MSKKKYLVAALIISTIGLVVLLYFLRRAISGIMTPFLLSILIIYLVSPIASKLEKKFKRSISIIVVYLGIVLIGALLIFVLIPLFAGNLSGLAKAVPEILENMQEAFSYILTIIEYSGWSVELKQAAYTEIQNALGSFSEYLSTVVTGIASITAGAMDFMFKLLVAFVIAFYVMRDREHFKKSALLSLPRKYREWTVKTAVEVNKVVSRFIQGQLIVAVIDGILETIGLYIAGVRYALVLGVIGGAFNLIPYFGPFIGAVPAVIIALLDSPLKAFWALLVFVIVQQIENNFISPRIMQDRVGLHPVTTIFALLAGSELLGIAGLLIAVPVTAVVKVLIKRVIDAVAS